MSATAPLQVGDLVGGKYRLEREIGAGGMGVVFSAIHIHLDQRVALKFLFLEAMQTPELVERFWREARAAVKIQSEHVARVIDVGKLDTGSPYIVMEYLEGEDLEAVVRNSGCLEVDEAVRYTLQACEALAEVHAQGMVHRDIKPANLFLATRPDGSSVVKVLDFGISKAAPVWKNDGLTNTQAVIGSPRYMSPEQLRSSRDVDARSDVWALGVTLFELLGGKSPFARGTMPEVCASILKDEPLSLAGLRPEIPRELESVIRRCLDKSPGGRYRNVAELALALRPFGPHGIIDISIERIVGTVQMGMMTTVPENPFDAPTIQVKSETPSQRRNRLGLESQTAPLAARAPTERAGPPPIEQPKPGVERTERPPLERAKSPAIERVASGRTTTPSDERVSTDRVKAPSGPIIERAKSPAVERVSGRTTTPSDERHAIDRVKPPSSKPSSGPIIERVKTPSKPHERASSPSADRSRTASDDRGDAARHPRLPTDAGESERHYMSRIGPRRQIPRIAMDARTISSLALDHRAGFLLSFVDGNYTIDDLLDVSGMPRVETLRIVCELLDLGVLALTPPQR